MAHKIDKQDSIPVTVIVAVKNEESRIRRCLESVCGFYKVFVVDSGSTDSTCDIAIEMGIEVVQFEYAGGWPKKRNWALQNLPIETDWVFLLDGDERITPDLKEELKRCSMVSDFDGYFVKWKFLFFGDWLKYSWSHGWMLRFFKHGKGEYEDLGMRGEGGWDAEVHENVVVDGKCGKLKALLEHENHDLTKWLHKQNEFSTWNAERRIQQCSANSPPIAWLLTGNPSQKRKLLKHWFLKLPFKSTFTFFYLYLFKLGFLDGKSGYYFCKLRAAHELNIQAKIHEMGRSSS